MSIRVQSPHDLDGYFDSPEDCPTKWLLMLRAYIDESGHEAKNWMFLAGYYGSCDHWEQFVSAWKEGLGPQRKSLHMSTLRWNKDRTKRLLAKLGPIPERCGLTGMLGGVKFSDYEDLVTGTPAARQLKGYMICLFPIVLQTLKALPHNERIELVFEQQNEYEPFVNMALPGLTVPDRHAPWLMTSDGLPKLAKWGFVPKGTTIMGDPADYLAFALREAWTDKTSKKAKWCRPILSQGSGEGMGAILSRKTIRHIISSTYMLGFLEKFDRTMAELYRDGIAARGIAE